MPPTVEDRLRDILETIIEIEDMLAGSSLDLFTADKMRRMATERYLEVACEAMRKLTDEVKRDAPNIEWQKMNRFRQSAAPCLSRDRRQYCLGYRPESSAAVKILRRTLHSCVQQMTVTRVQRR